MDTTQEEKTILTFKNTIKKLKSINDSDMRFKGCYAIVSSDNKVHHDQCLESKMRKNIPLREVLESPESHFHVECFQDVIRSEPRIFINRHLSFKLEDLFKEFDHVSSKIDFTKIGEAGSFQENIEILTWLQEDRGKDRHFSVYNYEQANLPLKVKELAELRQQAISHLVKNEGKLTDAYLKAYFNKGASLLAEAVDAGKLTKLLGTLEEIDELVEVNKSMLIIPAFLNFEGFGRVMEFYSPGKKGHYAHELFYKSLIKKHGEKAPFWQLRIPRVLGERGLIAQANFSNVQVLLVEEELNEIQLLTFGNLSKSFSGGNYISETDMNKAYDSTMALK